MIKREEYLKALDVVEAYHYQLKLQISIPSNGGKTSIDQWLLENSNKCSRRLIHIITADTIVLNNNYPPRIMEGGFKYIEDVTNKVFLYQRHAGMKTWDELVRVRGY